MQGYTPATYGDRIAEIYDSLYLERLDPAEAVTFLADIARGGRALELGIGTGRVAIPLSQAGVDVHGIEASEAMVAQLRAKPGGAEVAVTVADFTDITVEGSFGLIYVPFTTFFALQTQDQQVRCMRSVAEHLEDSGHFVLDAYVPVPALAKYTMNQATTTVETSLGHVMIDAMRHDPVSQLIEGNHIIIAEEGTKLYPRRVRYCWPSELDLMAQLAGLQLKARYDWYNLAPFTASSARHVSVYVKQDK